MKRILLLWGLILFSVSVYSQNATSLTKAVRKIHLELITTDNSDRAIADSKLVALNNLYYQSIKQGYQLGIEICGIDLMKQYNRKGAHQKIIEIGQQVIASAKTFRNSTTATEVHRLMGLAYSDLGFYAKALEEYHLTIDAISQVKTVDFRHYLRALAYENITSYFEVTTQHLDSMEYYYRKSIEEAKLISDTSTRLPSNYKFNAILYPHKDLADYYLNICKPPQPQKAQREIEIALKMNEGSHGKVMISNKIAFLSTLCQCLFNQKAYEKTITYGRQGLELESTAPSPYDRVKIYEMLAKSYLALNKQEGSSKYMNLYTDLKDSLQTSEKMQASAAVNQLLTSASKIHARASRQIILWALGVLFCIILIVYIIWQTDSRSLHKKYAYLLQQLREEKHAGEQKKLAFDPTGAQITDASNILQDDLPNDAISDINGREISELSSTDKAGNSGISDETLSRLQLKLEKFERSQKYLKPDINLAYLSHYLGTNPTYLTELLKVQRGTTYRNYINGLRIDYIKKKLYEDPIYREYKITHLAAECGFASRQVFISVFKKHTGMPPSFYINQLKSEKDLN
jgi:AraC-like DNA-binding protein